MWVTEWNDGNQLVHAGSGFLRAAEAAAMSNFVTVLGKLSILWSAILFINISIRRLINQFSRSNAPAALTSAGVAYMNLPSKVAYTQVWPSGSGRGIAQFHFETNALDSSGYGNNGFAVGDPNYVNGQVGQAVALDGTNSYIQLPPNMAQQCRLQFCRVGLLERWRQRPAHL